MKKKADKLARFCADTTIISLEPIFSSLIRYLNFPELIVLVKPIIKLIRPQRRLSTEAVYNLTNNNISTLFILKLNGKIHEINGVGNATRLQ